MKSRFRERKVAGFILIGIAAFSLFSFIVMSLWNAVLVPVVNVSSVTFWQAAGILLLSKILFSGFRGGGPFGRGRHQWSQEMKDKWQNMTPDEKEKMKQEWKQRCSGWGRRHYAETNASITTPNTSSDIN
ncbi:MAG: hypothetical protein V4717_08745 [Bacteroidota bacterium]